MKLTVVALIFVLFTGCQQEPEEKKTLGINQDLLLLSLISGQNILSTLFAGSTGIGSGTGSQIVANLFANGASLTGENSTESGSMGVSTNSTNSARAVTFSNGKITLTDETFDCPSGGTITFSGSQDISVTSRTDFYNKTTTMTNGTRTISYTSCKISDSLTLTSGTITVAQQTPDSGSTTMVSAITSGTSTSGTLRRTLSNFKGTVKGTLNASYVGAAGRTTTYSMTLDLASTITSRVMTYTLVSGSITSPRLVSRSGAVAGTVTIGTTPYTISKTLSTDLSE